MLGRMYGNYHRDTQNSGGWSKKGMRNREEVQEANDYAEELTEIAEKKPVKPL